jgi:GT2 family glycosyltransferase
MTAVATRVAAVVIGRNEGERLTRCLRALSGQLTRVVYVDSASTDGSVDTARALGVEVVQLSDDRPLSAARARNAGYERAVATWPDVEFVQFLDGDMELLDGWIEWAVASMDEQTDVGAVCGIRREKHPDRSVYNRICDVEWRVVASSPEVNFGGDVLIRCRAFDAVGGYDDSVLAAEDDELALRLRRRGYAVVRLDVPAVVHDADMHSFGEWWRRAVRCGHAYAQVGALHGRGDERKFVEPLRRAIVTGGVVPVALVAGSLFTQGVLLVGFAFYPADAARIAIGTRRRGYSWRDSAAWGASCAFGVVPQAFGALRYLSRHRAERGARIRSVARS